VGGVHGEVDAGSTIAAGGVAALFGGGEAMTEYLCDLTGGLGGRSDDTHLGTPGREWFRWLHGDLVHQDDVPVGGRGPVTPTAPGQEKVILIRGPVAVFVVTGKW
jgi:hypothetical protein